MLLPNFSVFVPGMPRERETERARETEAESERESARERARERERVCEGRIFKVLNVYFPFIKILFIKILLSSVARR